MPATLSRASDIKGLIARYSPPRQAAAPKPPPAQAAVHNRARPAAMPAAPAAVPPPGPARPPTTAQDIYTRHPMLREIANLEARAVQAAWEQAARNDTTNSRRTGFRFLAAAAGGVRSVAEKSQGA